MSNVNSFGTFLKTMQQPRAASKMGEPEPSPLRIVELLRDAGRPLADLHEASGLSLDVFLRLLNNLIDMGMVARTGDGETLISLTDEGRKVLAIAR
jgi:DNA-binding MarR family transcriptional regulator